MYNRFEITMYYVLLEIGIKIAKIAFINNEIHHSCYTENFCCFHATRIFCCK